MYFDIEDRPEIPRVPSALSVREGILLSLVVHLLVVIFLLLFPDALTTAEDPVEAARLAQLERERERQPFRFVEVMPLRDQPAPPVRPADASDMDRRSRSQEAAPIPDNSNPYMRGNSPELFEGGPAAPPEPAAPAPAPTPADPALPIVAATPQTPAPVAQAAQQRFADSLRNPSRYLSQERFDNPTGGEEAEPSVGAQFDTKGVDFASWILRVRSQLRRNWIIPTAAMSYSGIVVIRFNVLKNGFITDLTVLRPGPIPAVTTSVLNSVRLSNPFPPLPPEYPDDSMQMTWTYCIYRNPDECR